VLHVGQILPDLLATLALIFHTQSADRKCFRHRIETASLSQDRRRVQAPASAMPIGLCPVIVLEPTFNVNSIRH
jgi:hypothetical protein